MSAWHTRFARGDAHPRSVAALVNAVRTSLRATLALECGLLFVAAALLARAAALHSEVGTGAWPLAFLCGALCAAAWWLEHSETRAQTARLLDRRLRHDGALMTAYELEERRAENGLSSMEQLVRVRVLARLHYAEALRAMFRPLFVPIGAPVVAALVLLLVEDARRGPPPVTADLGALVEGLARALEAAALGARDEPRASRDVADRQPARRILALRVQELSAAFARGAPAAPHEAQRASELEARLADLDRRLSALLAGAEAEGPLRDDERKRLEEGRVWLDALRMGSRPEPGAGAGAVADGTGSGLGTAAGADGTISPLRSEPSSMQDVTSPTRSAAPVRAHASAAPVLGLQAGSFWPAEYDAVVARWVELSRAAPSASSTLDER